MAKPMAYVLDAWSVLAYLENESASEKIANLITDAHESGIPLVMSVVNAGEVWYIIAREISETEADQSIAEMRHLGVELVDVNWNVTLLAARFKSKCKMSFADCYAAALAKENSAVLVTGDREFKQVEDQIKINWV